MTYLLHQLIERSAVIWPHLEALKLKTKSLTYLSLWQATQQTARGLRNSGLLPQQRVAIYLPKQFETVIACFATVKAGAIFVPINPSLKSAQVSHILRDCNATILITNHSRLKSILPAIDTCQSLSSIICVDDISSATAEEFAKSDIRLWQWNDLDFSPIDHYPTIDTDIAALLYTSGSTGKPKGVVLSHRNMVAGAKSVADYLENTEQDKILAVLPFSFDYGFSQLTTAFYKGACVVLIDHLLPRDIISKVVSERITGLAAVPSLWQQLADLEWPAEASESLRYITNSGGSLPLPTLARLRTALPHTKPYLMYGLTEAFRSTYLAPDQLDKRPNSIGKAIPNAQVMVIRKDGTHCGPNEPGELVHRGSTVALGYWNDPQKTAERFKPVPDKIDALSQQEIAVWSGDTVQMDDEGYLYFIGRQDEMIKTSGYRVSPTEVEDIMFLSGVVAEAVALGLPHPTLGQAIFVIITANSSENVDIDRLFELCKQQLPSYMVPTHIIQRDKLPYTPNGKIDRSQLFILYKEQHKVVE